MSSERPEREENAFRIMRALSGVDEELLARSEGMDAAAETKDKKQGGNRKIVSFVNRHGRALAACLCLAVLGAAYFALELRRENEAQDGSGSGASYIYIKNPAMNEAEAQGKPNQVYEDGEEANDMAPGEMWDAEGSVVGGQTNGFGDTATAEDQYKDGLNEQVQAARPESRQELSLEEARECETLGAYVPKTIPAGCDFVKAIYEGQDPGSSLILTWSDEGHLFRIRLSQTLFAEPEEAAAEIDIAVYSATEDWEKTFWQPEKSGRLQFAVLYEDGVLAEYKGYLGKEDILKMFEKWPAEA